jgi:predicted GIY-YIG superfamily endonuclease
VPRRERQPAEETGTPAASTRAVRRTNTDAARKTKGSKPGPPTRHSVYVVFLRNPMGDGKAGYYVGMTGLTPEARLANHLSGIKAARVVTKYGVRLVPTLYEHLNPMTYQDALRMEGELADSLRKRGFQVFGGH